VRVSPRDPAWVELQAGRLAVRRDSVLRAGGADLRLQQAALRPHWARSLLDPARKAGVEQVELLWERLGRHAAAELQEPGLLRASAFPPSQVEEADAGRKESVRAWAAEAPAWKE